MHRLIGGRWRSGGMASRKRRTRRETGGVEPGRLQPADQPAAYLTRCPEIPSVRRRGPWTRKRPRRQAPPDDYRPTAGPDFTPTPEEEAEAAELLNDDEPDWDALADDAMALDVVCSGIPWL